MFTVLSLFGGAAAFEVRKRAVLHSKKKEIRELKDQQQHLDKVLESLKQQLEEASLENESTKSALDDVQEAATALGRLSQSLRKENLQLMEKQESLAAENINLKQENANLKTELLSLQKDSEAIRAELEHLRDEAKVAMEEFLDGVISKENLNNRLHALGVEVAFVDPVTQKTYDVNDDSWLLQMSSALDPEKTAKILMLGHSLENTGPEKAIQDAPPALANMSMAGGTAMIRTEHLLQATQARLISEEISKSPLALPKDDAKVSRVPCGQFAGGKENSAGTRTKCKASTGGSSKPGVAFQVVDGNQGFRHQQPRWIGEGRPGGSIAWKPNPMFQAETNVVIGAAKPPLVDETASLMDALHNSPPRTRTIASGSSGSSSTLSLR